MGWVTGASRWLSGARAGWVVAGVLALALVGGGIAYAVSRGHGHEAAGPAGTAAGGGAVRGRVLAVGADRLTLRVRGTTMTVLLGAGTRYGNKNHPGSKADLRVGETVRVVGDTSGTTITAKRVVIVAGGGAGSGNATTSSTRAST